MNSSNSFNICPHCGNNNSLNARFCSRCGTQLKVPEEVVVCRTCGTRNSPMANFCRNCGSQLKVGEQTKICPKCRKEVPIGDNTCTCGYSFATITTIQPEAGKPVAVRGTEAPKAEKGKKVREKKKIGPVSNKGGRGFAIVALIFLLIFAYFCAMPQGKLRPDAITALDDGFVKITGTDGAVIVVYMFQYLAMIVSNLIGVFTTESADPILGRIMGALGNSLGQQILTIMTVIFAISVVVHLIVVLVRIFSGKRSKKANGFYLVMAILMTLATAVVFLPNFFGPGFIGGFLDIIIFTADFSTGWILFAIPLYYWFFYLYSLIAKARPIKEQVV